MGLHHPLKKKRVWLQVNAVPQFRENEKRPYQVYSTFEDITEKREAEEKELEYRREIEVQNMELESIYHFLDKEIEKAMRIHERTLPQTFPQNEGLFFASHYRPAERMGGDFYNVIKKGRKLITYISDVSGHGMVGALLSSFVKNMINCYIQFTPEEDLTPSNMLEFLFEEYNKEEFPHEYFICIYITVLNLSTLELSYLGAGFQDDPLLSLKKNRILHLKNSGLPLSCTFTTEMLNLKEESIYLEPTSTLLFNTDGLTEQLMGRDPYGDRLKNVFQENCHRSPHAIIESINKDFKEFNHGSLQGDDDITLLIVQVAQEK